MRSTAKPLDHAPADGTLLFRGGRILAMAKAQPAPEVVVVRRGRIAAVGPRDLAAAFPEAQAIDLGGRTLMPGFIDAHNHLSIAALHPLWADLSRTTTPDAVRDALREQAVREPEARWVRGFDWNEATAGLLLDRRDLDALGFDRPVLVAHYTLHQCVVSSAGLDALAIGRHTPDPPGGEIVRGPDGEPTGVLVERAWSAAHAASVRAYADPDRFADLYEARARALLRDGITCVHDAACSPTAENIYARLAGARRLPISVLMMPHAEGILAPLDSARLDGPRTGEGDETLRVGAVKLFADGGAAPAIDVHLAGTHVEHGIAFPDLEESVAEVVRRGFGVAVHAIGNAGLESALRAFEGVLRAEDREHRFRVEHAMLASRSQVARLARLGAVGVVQPGFVDHVGRSVAGVEFDECTWLPFGDLARAGVAMAASSDDPCAFYAPLLTSAYGTTRICGSGATVGAEQALPYEDWLRAYTAGAAFAGGQEGERGSLEPGKRADLVLLEGALSASDPPRVVETWVDGRRVYAAH